MDIHCLDHRGAAIHSFYSYQHHPWGQESSRNEKTKAHRRYSEAVCFSTPFLQETTGALPTKDPPLFTLRLSFCSICLKAIHLSLPGTLCKTFLPHAGINLTSKAQMQSYRVELTTQKLLSLCTQPLRELNLVSEKLLVSDPEGKRTIQLVLGFVPFHNNLAVVHNFFFFLRLEG